MTEFIQSFGVLAPIIYVLMFMFLPVFFFPVPILAVAGGVAFGFVEGSLLTFVGASLNCYIMFVISRRFGREWVKNYLKKKMTPKQHDRIFNVSDEKLMMSLVILRLIPLVPYKFNKIYDCECTWNNSRNSSVFKLRSYKYKCL